LLSLAAWLLLIPLVLPLVSLFSLWSGTDVELWTHMARNVLPYSIRDTVILTAGVAVAVAVVGTTVAALTAYCDFPGRRFFQWAAVLPLAFPTYLSAYIYVELLDASGPVQTWPGRGSRRTFACPRSAPPAAPWRSLHWSCFLTSTCRCALPLRANRRSSSKWRAPLEPAGSRRSGASTCRWRARPSRAASRWR
jgi:hypothetical protein